MNRISEWNNWINALKEKPLPQQAEFSAQRAVARKKFSRRPFGVIIIPASVILTVFIAFVMLVNTSTAFARSIGEVHLFSDLARAVARDVGLRAAVDNKYVQPVRVSQIQDDIKVTLEYVIADTRQISIFFKINDQKNPQKKYGITNVGSPYLRDSNGWWPAHPASVDDELIEIRFVSRAGDIVPNNITLSFNLYSIDAWEEFTQSSEYDGRGMVPEFLPTQWSFDIPLDPALILPGKVYNLNDKEYIISGQKIVFQQLVVYPTRAVLSLGAEKSNSEILYDMDVTMKNDRNQQLAVTSNPFFNQENMSEIVFESNYFANSQKLNLYVNELSFISNKGQHQFTVNCENGEVDGLPEGAQMDLVDVNSNPIRLDCTVSGLKPLGISVPFFIPANLYSQEPASLREMQYSAARPSRTDENGEAKIIYVEWDCKEKAITLNLVIPYSPEFEPISFEINTAKP